jgi:hypothetical protein
MFITLALGLWFLNLFDALATWFAVSHGYAREGNPLMALALEHGTWLFFLIKLLMVTGALAALLFARARWPKMVAWTMLIITSCYIAICTMHVYFYMLWRAE